MAIIKINTLKLDIDQSRQEPLYQQLYLAIMSEINKGKITVGEKLPRVRELATKTGISYLTVSKAIQELVRIGMVESRPGIGIKVVKRSFLPTNPLKNIGIICTRQISVMVETSPFFGRIFNTLQDEISNKKSKLTYMRCSKQVSAKEIFSQMNSVDGLFVLGPEDFQKAALCQLGLMHCPVFVIGEIQEIPGVSRAFTNNVDCTANVIQRMIHKGCRKIAFVVDNMERYVSQLRLKGYCEAIERAGSIVNLDLVMVVEGESIGEAVAKLDPLPDGLFIANGLKYLPEALPELAKAGLIPGENCLMGGFDDNHWQVLSRMNIPYISINQDTNAIAKQAVDSMFKQINSHHEDQLIIVKSKVDDHS